MSTLTIHGISFPLPPRYQAGHPLTAQEAIALNQVRAENLRNNFTSSVKNALKAEGDDDTVHAALQAKWADYEAAYQFAGRQPRKTIDPIAREASKLAKAKILEQCRAKGFDPKSFADGKLDELVMKLVNKDPYYLAEAGRRVTALREAAQGSIDDLLDLGTATPVKATA